MSDFLGRPISGDTDLTNAPIQQDDPSKLLEAIDALLAVPGVKAARWVQYTPSWNDGEACTFGVRSTYVRIDGDDPEAGDYGDGFRDVWELIDMEDMTFVSHRDVSSIRKALSSLEGVLTSGRHYDVLQEKFGDPASVTATTAGFEVEYTEREF